MEHTIETAKPLALQGALNVRDLGGYPAAGGAVTRKGAFLRGDGLGSLTAEDCRLLVDYGVTCVVDLRAQRECREQPDAIHGYPGVAYHNVCMLDQLNSRDFADQLPDTMGEVYLSLMDDSGPALAQDMELLAANEGCSLFHCTAGKDRTGVVAMLLLDLAGVPRDVIVADYAVTEVHIAPLTERQTKHLRAMGVPVREHLFRSQPQDISRAYDHLLARYGHAEQYLAHIGCAPQVIEALKRKLLG